VDRDLSLPWLLIATPQLLDPSFRKSVVLVVEHNATGSMGFVLNRPLRTPIADIVTSSPLPIPATIPAWFGGPVESRTGIILHQRAAADAREDADEATQYRGGIAVSASATVLRAMIAAAQARVPETDPIDGGDVDPGARGKPAPGERLYPYRFLVGYTGWGAGQLQRELQAGAWIQLPASDTLVFDTSWKELWELCYGEVGFHPRMLAPTVQSYMN
jgi:putative transcriptional regulator